MDPTPSPYKPDPSRFSSRFTSRITPSFPFSNAARFTPPPLVRTKRPTSTHLCTYHGDQTHNTQRAQQIVPGLYVRRPDHPARELLGSVPVCTHVVIIVIWGSWSLSQLGNHVLRRFGAWSSSRGTYLYLQYSCWHWFVRTLNVALFFFASVFLCCPAFHLEMENSHHANLSSGQIPIHIVLTLNVPFVVPPPGFSLLTPERRVGPPYYRRLSPTQTPYCRHFATFGARHSFLMDGEGGG